MLTHIAPRNWRAMAAPVAVSALVLAVVVVAQEAGGTDSRGQQVASPLGAPGEQPAAPSRDSRPAADVQLPDDHGAVPAGSTVPVAAELPQANIDLVIYQSRGSGQCTTVVGDGETQALCRPSLREALSKEALLVSAVGPTRTLESMEDATGRVIKEAFTWGVAPEHAVSIRFTRAATGAVEEVQVSKREDTPELTFFLAGVHLSEPMRIEALDDRGEVVASRDW